MCKFRGTEIFVRSVKLFRIFTQRAWKSEAYEQPTNGLNKSSRAASKAQAKKDITKLIAIELIDIFGGDML